MEAYQIRSRISPYMDSSLPYMVKLTRYTEGYRTAFSTQSESLLNTVRHTSVHGEDFTIYGSEEFLYGHIWDRIW